MWKFSLHDINKDLFLSNNLSPLRNPYTNISFKLNELCIIYNKLQESFSKQNKCLPIWLFNFKRCYFDLNVYISRFFKTLLKKSIESYIEDTSKENFMNEFTELVNSDPDIRKYFCKKCYRKLNIKEILKDTVISYILNSNNIYTFGSYKKQFIHVIQTENLIYTKNHYLIHRRRVKVRRNRSNQTAMDITSHPFS